MNPVSETADHKQEAPEGVGARAHRGRGEGARVCMSVFQRVADRALFERRPPARTRSKRATLLFTVMCLWGAVGDWSSCVDSMRTTAGAVRWLQNGRREGCTHVQKQLRAVAPLHHLICAIYRQEVLALFASAFNAQSPGTQVLYLHLTRIHMSAQQLGLLHHRHTTRSRPTGVFLLHERSLLCNGTRRAPRSFGCPRDTRHSLPVMGLFYIRMITVCVTLIHF